MRLWEVGIFIWRFIQIKNNLCTSIYNPSSICYQGFYHQLGSSGTYKGVYPPSLLINMSAFTRMFIYIYRLFRDTCVLHNFCHLWRAWKILTILALSSVPVPLPGSWGLAIFPPFVIVSSQNDDIIITGVIGGEVFVPSIVFYFYPGAMVPWDGFPRSHMKFTWRCIWPSTQL